MKILYLGDDNLKGAASYLSAMLNYAGLSFDYVPSDKIAKFRKEKYDLYILSDFPVGHLSDAYQEIIRNDVKSGSGLLMIGGWESFYGAKGEYHKTIIEEVLPVECLNQDDRVNYCRGLVTIVRREHPSIENLPWSKPPIVCGFNKVKIKRGAQEILSLQKININNDKISIDKTKFPLLVFGKYGNGITCALTTDLAPHWVGGMVDWGTKRITAKAKEGAEIEVGSYYAKFVKQLIRSIVKS